MTLLSPLTGSSNVILEKTIDCRFIIDSYRSWLDIDVEKYFDGLNTVHIYRCQDTGYRFYYPFNLEGDNNLYEELQSQPWYYADWKWEFEVASRLIKSSDQVLEIGSGRGAFIRHLQEKGITCTGLEFNKDALDITRVKGLNVIEQSVQEHAVLHPQKYDVVCSFQVLEHVSCVKEFLQASIDALKVGGRLIIAVPNNNSYIKYAKDLATNMPPHHMGLWSIESLENLQKVFRLKLEIVKYEPLDNCEWYYNLQSRRVVDTLGDRKIAKFATKGLARLLFMPGCNLLRLMKNSIPGQAILIQYAKLN